MQLTKEKTIAWGYSHNAVQPEISADPGIGEESERDWCRVGKAGGFENDAIVTSVLRGLLLQIGECLDDVLP